MNLWKECGSISQTLTTPMQIEGIVMEERKLALTLIALYNCKNENAFSYNGITYDSDVEVKLNFMSDEDIRELIKQIPYDTHLLKPDRKEKLLSCYNIFQNSDHVICSYTTHEKVQLWRAMFYGIMIPFALMGDSIVYMQFPSVYMNIELIIMDGKADTREWLNDYIDRVLNSQGARKLRDIYYDMRKENGEL